MPMVNPGAGGASPPQAAGDAIANPTAGGFLSFLIGWTDSIWARVGVILAGSNYALLVSLASDIRGENATTKRLDVSTPHSTAIMTTATTTTHLTGAGRFRGLRIGKDVATGVITVYDNTAGSGAILDKYTAGAAAVAVPPRPCDIPVATGITVVTSQAFDVMIDWNANP